MFDLIVYEQANGKRPYEIWFQNVRDAEAKSRIAKRMRSVAQGSLGDCKSVGEGILELRVDVGAGYRIYCGRYGEALVILLCGGNKSTQANDIARSREFWADWKRSNT